MNRVAFLSLFALASCMGKPAPTQDQAPAGEGSPGAEASAEVAAAVADPGAPAPECPHGIHEGGAGCDQEPDAPAASAGHFGAPFSLEKAVALASAVGEASEEPVRVKGTVDAVCQKKGCWMVLADGETKARILMKDHAFAVPMDCKGKAAEVEGTLKARTFTEGQVKHLEEDRGGDPSQVSGERKEYVLTATAVEVVDS